MAVFGKKWISLVVGAVILILIFLGLAGRDDAPEAPIARVVRQDITASITSNGKVEPIQPFILRARYSGFVDSTDATEGEPVKKDQLLLTLNSSDIQAQLAQARADLVEAKQAMRAAEAGGPPDQVAQLNGDIRKAQIDVQNYQRMQDALQKLVQEHAATQDEYDQNQAALARSQAALTSMEQRKADLATRARSDGEQAKFRADQASSLIASLENKVRSATVTSPIFGTLYSLPVRKGDYVQTGDILAEVADLHKIRVRAFVDEPDLGWLALGQTVDVTWDAYSGHVWKGLTEQLPRQVVARGNRSVGEVLCSVENDEPMLIPNVNVDVRILVRESKNALVVPRAAVRTQGADHIVYVFSVGTVHSRRIQIGIFDASRYEVLSGLQEGERVILPGDLVLHDGMAIRPTEANAAE